MTISPTTINNVNRSVAMDSDNRLDAGGVRRHNNRHGRPTLRWTMAVEFCSALAAARRLQRREPRRAHRRTGCHTYGPVGRGSQRTASKPSTDPRSWIIGLIDAAATPLKGSARLGMMTWTALIELPFLKTGHHEIPDKVVHRRNQAQARRAEGSAIDLGNSGSRRGGGRGYRASTTQHMDGAPEGSGARIDQPTASPDDRGLGCGGR